MSGKSPFLFVYGTLMVPEVVRRLLGHELHMRPARLGGFSRFRVKEAVYPGIIVGAADDFVDGQLLSGMTQADWETLDRYEGNEYARRSVQVLGVDGEELLADAYVFKHPGFLTDEPWDDSDVLNKLRALGLQ